MVRRAELLAAFCAAFPPEGVGSLSPAHQPQPTIVQNATRFKDATATVTSFGLNSETLPDWTAKCRLPHASRLRRLW